MPIYKISQKHNVGIYGGTQLVDMGKDSKYTGINDFVKWSARETGYSEPVFRDHVEHGITRRRTNRKNYDKVVVNTVGRR